MLSEIERLQLRLQDNTADPVLLSELLEDAQALILGFLQRDELPDACTSAKIRLAQILYNRLGMEGSAAHSEGGMSDTVETGIPEEIKAMIRPWRLAKVGSA